MTVCGNVDVAMTFREFVAYGAFARRVGTRTVEGLDARSDPTGTWGAEKISNGREDLRQSLAPAEFLDGSTIGNAKEK